MIFIQGIICVVRKSRVPNKNRVRAIIAISVLKSFATTLHYSWKYFNQSAREILNTVKRDFFILKDSVVYEEVSKCIACLSTEHYMFISQRFALNQVPKTIRTDLHFEAIRNSILIHHFSKQYILWKIALQMAGPNSISLGYLRSPK